MSFIIFAAGSALFFAITFFLRKQAGNLIPIQTAYFIETCMQMALITIAFFVLSPGIKFESKSMLGYIFAAFAGITVVIAVGLSYLALKLGFLSTYQAITSPSQIIFAVLLGVLLINESFSVKQVIGTVISIAGILLIILK